jgi:hypothetical protein
MSPDIRHRQHLLRVDILVVEGENNVVHIAHNNRTKAHDTRFHGGIKNDPSMDMVMNVLFNLQEGIQLGMGDFAVSLFMAGLAAPYNQSVVDDDCTNRSFTGQAGLFSLAQGFPHKVVMVKGIEIHDSFLNI